MRDEACSAGDGPDLAPERICNNPRIELFHGRNHNDGERDEVELPERGDRVCR